MSEAENSHVYKLKIAITENNKKTIRDFLINDSDHFSANYKNLIGTSVFSKEYGNSSIIFWYLSPASRFKSVKDLFLKGTSVIINDSLESLDSEIDDEKINIFVDNAGEKPLYFLRKGAQYLKTFQDFDKALKEAVNLAINDDYFFNNDKKSVSDERNKRAFEKPFNYCMDCGQDVSFVFKERMKKFFCSNCGTEYTNTKSKDCENN